MNNLLKRYLKQHHGLFLMFKRLLLYIRYVKSLGQKGTYSSFPSCRGNSSVEIVQNGYHSFFGYYDKSPMSPDGKYIAFLKVKDRKTPSAAEVCLFGMVDRKIKIIAKTNTWNWQQGCMLQWIDNNTISYNDFRDGRYVTILLDVSLKKEVFTNRSAYSYNSEYSKFLSLNFYRLDLYAKGYGYPFNEDGLDIKIDGIWEVDVKTNTSTLILTLEKVMNFEPKIFFNCQHYINHVAYCPDESFIIFIHRWQIFGGEFKSRLLKYDMQKKILMTLLDNGHVSHYCWKSNNELLVYATNDKGEKGYLLLNVNTGENHLVEGMPKEDGHPSYSKDGKWILTDTYPNNQRKQYLLLFHTEEKKLYKVDQLYSPFKYFNESRCDLHPRWSYDNQYICVDNTQSGYRTLKIFEFKS